MIQKFSIKKLSILYQLYEIKAISFFVFQHPFIFSHGRVGASAHKRAHPMSNPLYTHDNVCVGDPMMIVRGNGEGSRCATSFSVQVRNCQQIMSNSTTWLVGNLFSIFIIFQRSLLPISTKKIIPYFIAKQILLNKEFRLKHPYIPLLLLF